MHDIELHVTLCNFLLYRHQVAYIVSILQLMHEMIQSKIQTQVFGGKYVHCVRLPCTFHTSLYMLMQFPPIQTVTGPLCGRLHANYLCSRASRTKSQITCVVALTKGVVDLTIPYFYRLLFLLYYIYVFIIFSYYV